MLAVGLGKNVNIKPCEIKYHRQLENVSFDKLLDHTAEVHFSCTVFHVLYIIKIHGAQA